MATKKTTKEKKIKVKGSKTVTYIGDDKEGKPRFTKSLGLKPEKVLIKQTGSFIGDGKKSRKIMKKNIKLFVNEDEKRSILYSIRYKVNNKENGLHESIMSCSGYSFKNTPKIVLLDGEDIIMDINLI